MSMQPHATQKGYSLINLILYTALVALTVVFITQFTFTVLVLRNKTAAQRAVWENARYVMERMVHQIRAANTLDLPYSDFIASPGTLALLTNIYDIDEPQVRVIFFVDGNKRLIFSREGYTDEMITDEMVEISALTLTRYTDGTSESIRIVLTLDAKSPSSRFDYQATYTLATSILIRKK